MGNDAAGGVIRAAGAVLWRPSRRYGVRIALVHRPRYDDWSLPKGKAEPGEVPLVTAAREVEEETGFRAAIGRSLTTVSYKVNGGPKTVQYFAARRMGGLFTPNKEVDKLEWLPMAKAGRADELRVRPGGPEHLRPRARGAVRDRAGPACQGRPPGVL